MRFRAKLETIMEFEPTGGENVYQGKIGFDSWRITRGYRYWYGENISTAEAPIFAAGGATELLKKITGQEVDLA